MTTKQTLNKETKECLKRRFKEELQEQGIKVIDIVTTQKEITQTNIDMDDSELWDTLQRINKTWGLNIQVISHGEDCYTITNEEYTGNMNEILSFLYGIQYAASTLINKLINK